VSALKDLAELEREVKEATSVITLQRIKVLNAEVENAIEICILSKRLGEAPKGVGQRLLGDSASDSVSLSNLR
jgi:hypothetical protein